ncbi:sodium:proline symporter [Leptospira kobayashii]|uniref:Sodium:proline symporter n=1 Tax=Leptospira kobayashii TaxID=1917830 RepID=A0ABN6KD17_9LEPT|nr:sodium:solute symporter family protein [Leptospira kobayashii]BDA78860.1 sodium:proline symporter [Leptospira kobayashii]
MIQFSTFDLILFVSPFLIILGILVYSSKLSKPNLKNYFQAEGKMSWFVAGTAMVATTFAADTPLAVTEIVRNNGISGNWIWWYMAIGGFVTVFFFSKLWKRSGATTDLELIQIRYSGKEALYLRGFKSVFIGLFLNLVILGWVNLAMLKILQVFFPEYSSGLLLALLLFIGIIYTSIAGLRGISYIDVFQFFLAWGGCLIYAWQVLDLPSVGGLSGLKDKLPPSTFHFFPSFTTDSGLPFDHFLIMLTVIWWSSWYPGAEPGGGGYIAQRILSTSDEKSAFKSSLWFVFAHYFLRPWPWILVAIASLILFPVLSPEESGKGFLLILNEISFPGMKGLLLSAFLAAYLSTLATHLNWGASYLVVDLWKPILQKSKQDSYYLKVSYLIQILTGVLSLLLALYGMDTIKGAWVFLLEASSGIGFVLIARWYYWRISAFTEILALFVSPFFYIVFSIVLKVPFPYSILCTSVSSVIVLLISTRLLPGTSPTVLLEFYNKTKPPILFWKGLAKELSNGIPLKEYSNHLIYSLLGVISGILLIFSGLYSIQSLFWNRESLVISLIIFLSSLPLMGISIQKAIKD